jgi:drug/metabolite transporter (DMT)-like permease
MAAIVHHTGGRWRRAFCNNRSVKAGAHRTSSSLLAWYFVTVWGSGYLATKVGLQYAPPFTFLTLRFAFGLLLVVPLAIALRPVWPESPATWFHVAVAGLLMHAVNLGGSHYAQYLGMSAGIAALILALQPLATAMVAARLMHENLQRQQWVGIALGLAGVALVVWHKLDLAAMSAASLAAVTIALAAITAGTLYQRIFCPAVDLRAAAVVQFGATLLVLAPLALLVEGFQVRLVLATAGRHRFPGDLCLAAGGQRPAHVDAARRGDPGHEPALPDAGHRGRARVVDVRCAAFSADRDRHRGDLRRRGAGRDQARARVASTVDRSRLKCR